MRKNCFIENAFCHLMAIVVKVLVMVCTEWKSIITNCSDIHEGTTKELGEVIAREKARDREKV